MRFGKIFFFIVLVACVIEITRLWFLAPDQMASHFNIQGSPDSFVPKIQFFSFQIQTALVVIGLGFLMQLLILVIPAKWINMPHREYWLASERRAATIENQSSFAYALFGAVLLVVQVGFELSLYANLQKPILFAAPIMLLVIAGFFIFSFFMLIQLGRSFRLPPAG
jgi:uncharacterized membrane protein